MTAHLDGYPGVGEAVSSPISSYTGKPGSVAIECAMPTPRQGKVRLPR
jgi:hypothetical protein